MWCIVPRFSSRLVLGYWCRVRGCIRCQGRFGRPLSPFGSCGWRASTDCLRGAVRLRGRVDALGRCCWRRCWCGCWPLGTWCVGHTGQTAQEVLGVGASVGEGPGWVPLCAGHDVALHHADRLDALPKDGDGRILLAELWLRLAQ